LLTAQFTNATLGQPNETPVYIAQRYERWRWQRILPRWKRLTLGERRLEGVRSARVDSNAPVLIFHLKVQLALARVL
jgi:hypothetical protein